MSRHHPRPRNYGSAFKAGIVLNLAYAAIEAAVGVWIGSLALVADAGHNLSDVAGLALSWGGAALAERPPTMHRTYGMRRATILAALGNALLLVLAVGAILWHAVGRFLHPQPVAGGTMIAVAVAGLVVNSGTALMFFRGRKEDLNVRSAFLHMAADAGVTAGVLLSGALILWRGWTWVDPVIGIVVAFVILVGTWQLLRDSLNLVLDAVPQGIDPDAVMKYLESLPGVEAVHDLHIWGMSTTESALTAHLVKPEPSGDDGLLARACREIPDRFGIRHVTLQLERGGVASVCGQAGARCV